MSAVLPIEPDPRFRRYTASAGQKLFSIKFPFQQNEDIAIFLFADGIYTEISPTLYSIVGAGEPEGGSVTFNTGRNEGEVIATVGRAILDRMSSVVRDGRFSSRLIDDEFDRNRIIQQEQQRDIDRSLKFDFGVSFGIIETPEDGRVLMWRQNGPFWHIVNGPSAQEIADAEANAEAARQAAEEAKEAAARINLPDLTPGDAGSILTVKSDGSGYEFHFATITVPSRTVLKSLPPIFGSVNLTEAGREGLFILKTGAPPVSDTREGIFVVSNTSGYFWQRVFEGPAIAQWFGAIGDGQANDAPVINDALTVWRDIRLPAKLKNGQLANYKFSSSITLNAGNCLSGDASRSKISLPSAMSADVFNLVGTQITVKDLLIYGDRTQTNRLFRFRTDLGNVAVVKIDNVWSDGCAGIYHDANSTGLLTNLFITNCTNTGVTGRSVYFQDALAFIFLQRVTFDYVGVTEATSNVAAIVIANNEGAILEDVDVLGGTKIGFANRDGFRIENSRAVWLKRCMADHMGGWGFYISDSDYVYFETCTSSLCNKDQFYINTNSRWITAMNCYAGGSNGEAGSIAGVHGWLIENSLYVTLTGGSTSNNTGKGVVTSGATTRFQGNGLSFLGNVGGNFTLGSTMSHLAGCILDNGSALTNQTNTSG